MKEINEHINLLEIEGHSGWKEGKLNNICNCIISGGTPLTSIKEYYNKGTIAWIKTKEVLNNKIYDSEYKISELGLLKSSAKLLPINSIIIAMYGDGDTAGRVAVNKIPLATNQACGNLIINPEIADFQFVFYYLLNSYDELVYLKSGNGQQNLNLKTLKDFDIKVPPLKEQTAIASILSSLDDKIYLLHRQNKTLDQLAETLLRQWFVEEVEESWEEKSLPEIADYLNGLALQKFPAKGNDFLPVIKIREMKQGISENSDKCNRDIPSQYIVQDGDVLFSWSGSVAARAGSCGDWWLILRWLGWPDDYCADAGLGQTNDPGRDVIYSL